MNYLGEFAKISAHFIINNHCLYTSKDLDYTPNKYLNKLSLHPRILRDSGTRRILQCWYIGRWRHRPSDQDLRIHRYLSSNKQRSRLEKIKGYALCICHLQQLLTKVNWQFYNQTKQQFNFLEILHSSLPRSRSLSRHQLSISSIPTK